jgi:CheY-like chemotaxis protein
VRSETKYLTLLLVEDSPDDAFLFELALRKTGLVYSLHHAANGKEAVEYLESALGPQGPDLPQFVFLDLNMPVMNGFQVLKWIKRQSFPASTRVIVLSGFDHLEDVHRAAKCGMSEYVLKPIDVANLSRILQGGVSLGMKHQATSPQPDDGRNPRS